MCMLHIKLYILKLHFWQINQSFQIQLQYFDTDMHRGICEYSLMTLS